MSNKRDAAGRWLAAGASDAARFFAALHDPRASQEAILFDTLRANAATDYGRRFGFGAIASVAEYQRRVPIVTYDDVEADILRVAGGEANVLTTEPVTMFEKTSGSTAAAKYIPYTESLRRQFTGAVSAWMHDLYGARPGLGEGSAYWSISPLAAERERTSGGLAVGFEDDRDYFAGDARDALGELLALPPSVARIRDVATMQYVTLRTLAADESLAFISVWNPTFLTALMTRLEEWSERLVAETRDARLEALLARDGRLVPQHVWPRLRVISCWMSAAAALAVPRLAAAFPDVELQPKGLLATEGVVSIPIVAAGGAALAVTSHFLEFVDVDGGGVHLAHELRGGREYRVLLTTGGGLYRYDLGDVVHVTGRFAETPLVEFTGRAADVSDLCGEKLSEAFVGAALAGQGIDAALLFLAPRWGDPPRYSLFAETGAAIDAALVDEALRQNPHYRYCREAGQLAPVEVIRLRRGAAGEWLRLRAGNGRTGDVKPRALERDRDWLARIDAAGLVEAAP